MTGMHDRLLAAVLLVVACPLGVASELGSDLAIREVSRTTETVTHDADGHAIGSVRVRETAVFHSVKVSETWTFDQKTGQDVLQSRTTVEQDSEKNTVTKLESRDATTGEMVSTQITTVRRTPDGGCATVVQTLDEFGRLMVSRRTVSAHSPDGDSRLTEEISGADGALTIRRQITTLSDGRVPAVR